MMAITGTHGKPEEEEAVGGETTTAHGDSEPQKKDLKKGTVYQSNITLSMYGQMVSFLNLQLHNLWFTCSWRFVL